MKYVVIILIFVTLFRNQIAQIDDYGSIENSKCNTEADCQKYSTLDDNNNPTAHCNGYNSFCKCITGFGPVVNTTTNLTSCQKLATKLNDTCNVNVQCQLVFGMESICSGDKCICREGSNFKETNMYCYHGNESYSCTSSSDCGGAECDSKFCKCRNLEILRRKDKEIQCYKVSNICDFDQQCQYGVKGSNSFCNNARCDCNKGYAPRETGICSLKIGALCVNNNDCLYNNCTQRRCECPANKFYTNNDCFDKLNLNDNCSFSEQCSKTINQAYCQDHICQCNNNSIPINGNCYEKGSLGDKCQNNEQCKLLPNMECIENKCSCKSGYRNGNDKKACFINGTYGERCNFTEDCELIHAICTTEKLCECNIGEVFEYERHMCHKPTSILIPCVIITIFIGIVLICVIVFFLIRKKSYSVDDVRFHIPKFEE